MKYGFDMNNKTELKEFFEYKQKQFKRMLDTTHTPEEKYIMYLKEKEELFKYFIDRDKLREDIENEIESILNDVLSKIDIESR